MTARGDLTHAECDRLTQMARFREGRGLVHVVLVREPDALGSWRKMKRVMITPEGREALARADTARPRRVPVRRRRPSGDARGGSCITH